MRIRIRLGPDTKISVVGVGVQFRHQKLWVSVSVSEFMTHRILVSVSDIRDTRKTGVGVGFPTPTMNASTGVGCSDTQNLGSGIGIGRSTPVSDVRHRCRSGTAKSNTSRIRRIVTLFLITLGLCADAV